MPHRYWISAAEYNGISTAPGFGANALGKGGNSLKATLGFFELALLIVTFGASSVAGISLEIVHTCS